MAIALFSAAVLLVLAWVLQPVLSEGVWSGAPALERDPDEARRRRDNALAGLRDLEMDRETGKVEPEDYLRIRAEYESEAVEAMEELDSLEGESGTDRG